MDHNNQEPKFSDYLSVLLKWKKFILINCIVLGLIVFGITFFIPETFKAKAVVMLPQNSQSLGFGAIGNLLGGAGSLLGGKTLGGIGGNNTDKMMGILESRLVLENVIEKFDLKSYYEVKNDNRDLILKAFKNDIDFDVNENRMIEITVINKNPQVSADMANYFVMLLDSLNKYYGVLEAANNRGFIEKRYFQNLMELKSAEDSLNHFQKKYGVFSVPDQVKAAISAAGQIEGEMMKQEILTNAIKLQLGENSPSYKTSLEQLDMIKSKVHELKKGDKLSYESVVLLPFKNTPDLGIKYLRLLREIEIQQKILEVVLPMYEQAKVEEQKNIATIIVLDTAVPPTYKDAPKRATITIVVMLPIFFMIIAFVFMLDNNLLNSDHNSNKVETLLKSWAEQFSRLYRIS